MLGGNERVAEFLSGKFGTRLEAATVTMQALDQHIQQLNTNIQALIEELRRSRGP